MYKEGFWWTQIDLKQATVYDLGVGAKVIEAKNKFELAIAYLRFLTDDNSITDVKGFAKLTQNINSLKDLQNSATNKRDDYKWMKYNVKTLKTKIDFDSDKLPVIGAHLEYGFNDDTLSLDGDKDYYLGAIGLQYNIFDGFSSTAKEEPS